MKKRTTAIGAAMLLLPLGKPLVIKAGFALKTSGAILSIQEEAKSNSADYYYHQGNNKLDAGDNSGAISDYDKAIKIDLKHALVTSVC